MPLKFEVKKKLISRSERVKSVELHPDLPWVLVALFSGNITIYDYTNQTTVKTIEVSQSPVRNAKFIVRKQQIITGSDDLQVRVYNYNTMERIKQFEAHSDYIRYLMVHGTQPYVFTSSDDATIKIWDMDKDFSLVRTLEDHVHYVMMLCLNPRDPGTFASASMDRTVKVWSTNGTKANFTLTGHSAGVNCVDYYRGDKPYLMSGGDDRLVKVWDYQTKQCIHSLEGHQQNISSAVFHPELPLIISTSEDGSIRFWHSQTYKLENTLNYNMERVWSVDISKDGTNYMAFGFDEGTIVVKIGNDEPVVSMNSGKVVYAKNMEFFALNLKALNVNDPEFIKDGTNLSVQPKELGLSDIYPVGISHSPNGHLFGIYSDSEYSIYRSQTFKNSGFGTGTDLVWSNTGDYAVREMFAIKVYRGSSNTLLYELKTDFAVEQLFGGLLLAARSGDFVIFYHWESAKVIRRIDVSPRKIIWNDNTFRVAIATQEELYILQFHNEQLEEILQKDEEPEGSEEAFEVLFDLIETVTSGTWVSNVFYFTNAQQKICYTTNGKIFILDTEKRQFIIGHIQAQNRMYLMDKFFSVSSYDVNYQVAEFQGLIAIGQTQEAIKILKEIDPKYYNSLAKYLDTLGLKKLAFQIVTDKEHKFDLALQLGQAEIAFELAQSQGQVLKLRQVGDIALQQGRIELAINSLEAAGDLSGLFLIYSSLGLADRLKGLAKKAQDETKMNIAFQCYFTLGDVDKCLEVLLQSKRYPEAAFFAKTYCPSKIPICVKYWKESLQKEYPIISQKIANPFDHPDQFGDLKTCIKIESFYRSERQCINVPAHQFQEFHDLLNIDVFQLLKEDPDYDLSQFTLQPQSK